MQLDSDEIALKEKKREKKLPWGYGSAHANWCVACAPVGVYDWVGEIVDKKPPEEEEVRGRERRE